MSKATREDGQGADWFNEVVQFVEKNVRQYPIGAAGLAIGVGFVMGRVAKGSIERALIRAAGKTILQKVLL